jgi:hypothetical protein
MYFSVTIECVYPDEFLKNKNSSKDAPVAYTVIYLLVSRTSEQIFMEFDNGPRFGEISQ